MNLAAKYPEVGSEERFQRDDDMVFRRLGEEMVLVPIRRGIGDFDCFYILNDLGRFVWERLQSPQSINELIDAIVANFTVDREDAQKDLQVFLDKLISLKALKQ